MKVGTHFSQSFPWYVRLWRVLIEGRSAIFDGVVTEAYPDGSYVVESTNHGGERRTYKFR